MRLAVLAAAAVLALQSAQQDPPPAPAERPAGPILTGRVTDERGHPLPGVTIRLYAGFATRWPGQHTTTGADGVYRFEPLETGAMTFRGEDGGNAGEQSFYYTGIRIEHPTHVSNERSAWWDIEVPTRDGHVETRDFAMIEGGRLEGRVLAPSGFGWGEIDLRFVPLDPAHGNATGWYATTDHRGRFSAEAALTPGPYAVQWNCPGADYPELARVDIRPGEMATLTINMKLTVEVTSETRGERSPRGG